MSWRQRPGFTFVWKIENFRYCFQKPGEDLISPTFKVKAFPKSSKWRLILCPHSARDYYAIDLCLQRTGEEDNGPSRIGIDYELAVLAFDESLHEVGIASCNFDRGGCDEICRFMSRKDCLKSQFLVNNTLTVCCRMWNRCLEQSVPKMCFARTRIRIQRLYFVTSVENISGIKENHQRVMPIKQAGPSNLQLTMMLFMQHNSEMLVRINLIDTNHPIYASSIISVVNTTGNTSISVEDEHWFDTEFHEHVWIHAICLNKGELMSNKTLYLPNDTLYLECDIGLSYGIDINEIQDVEVGQIYTHDFNKLNPAVNTQVSKPDPQLSQWTSVYNTSLAKCQSLSTLKEIPHDPFKHSCVPDFKQLLGDKEKKYDLKENHGEFNFNSTDLLNDLQNAFHEKILSDVTLKTETEMFSANKFILSARSTVFKAMFSSNMREKFSGSIEIPDLDADTVREMLSYLYTDSLEDLDVDRASKLYFAADKYNVISLKKRCSTILKAKLSESKACEVLVLADLHQDSDLKAAVQNFILRKDSEILCLEEWKYFEKFNPKLAIETLRLVCLKKVDK